MTCQVAAALVASADLPFTPGLARHVGNAGSAGEIFGATAGRRYFV